MREQRYHGVRGAIPCAAGACLALFGWRWWRPFRVAALGRSMEPSVASGDFLVATRAARRQLRRGALVVVEHPAKPGFEMVKRLAAVPGDRIGERILDRDEYWVLGDDPGASTDSRAFGSVARAAIRGVVRVRYWPPRRAGVLPRGSLPGRTRSGGR